MLKALSCCFSAKTSPLAISLGLLILRAVSGGMMLYAHGYGKLAKFSEVAKEFPDPIGIGNTPSLALAVGAEFFCSIFVILGLGTRLAAIPLMATMSVAAFVIHRGELFTKGELALLYLAAFALILLAGPGRFSVDAGIGGKIGKVDRGGD